MLFLALGLLFGTYPGRDSLPKARASSASNDSSSSSWSSIGEQIRQFRTRAQADKANGKLAIPDAIISTFGPYETEPIDISDVGRYELTAGPLSAADADRGETGLHSINFPPDADDHIQWQINVADIQIVLLNGMPFVRIPITVIRVVQPYLGLRLWLG